MGVFQFLQFTLVDDLAAMKVGTDAVLLGAWVPVQNAHRVLDVGTGTGILALMIAQRTEPSTWIDAIEVQEPDANQARQNVMASPWAHRIAIHHLALQDFEATRPYDLMVCNPPYFGDSLLPPSAHRATARHSLTLQPADLCTAAQSLLGPDGRWAVILPPPEERALEERAAAAGWIASQRLHFFTRAGKPEERTAVVFVRDAGNCTDEHLTLYDEGNTWSEGYGRLTSEFYLPRK